MQATKRQAVPLRVHQLWDAIQNPGSNQVMDFDRLAAVITTLHKVPKDELNQELERAIKDGLVVSEAVETQRREETEIYKIPDPASVEKGDHDWYCFQCHLPGQVPVVKCEDCPRVYHLECLPEDRKPEKDLFVCPACHIMATKPSAEKVAVKPKILNQLLMYICNRFKSWQIEMLEKADGRTWASAANRPLKEAWRFNLLIYMPMDLETMVNKASNGKYTSLEEFQVDCETLVHAIGIYFGLDMLKGGQIGQAFLRDAIHDIQEIKLCHDCFRRSNEKNHDWWFCLPCAVPHEVVWAKQTGYPYWPAKVMKKDGNKYDVRYFGGNYERGIIDAKNIQPIETSITQLKVRRTAIWNEAYEELMKFQEIAKDPELAAQLPPRGRGGSSAAKSKAGKRGASQSPEEVAPKKSRRSEQNNSVATPKNSRKSGAPKAGATPRSNGSAASTPVSAGSPKKKTGASAKSASAATARRESSSGSRSTSGSTSTPGTSTKTVKVTVASKEKKQVYTDLSETNLDPEVISFLHEIEDNESLDGDAYFSDEDSNELHEKVSEDAVSSSCNESKSARSVYVQVAHQGLVREKLIKKFTELQARHAQELSQNKKKQWCYNCEREAIYHCCWNTAYCSIECQQVHWTREHKRLCRRVRRERAGTTGTSQTGEEY